METHVKVLGALNIAFGALGVVGALALMLVFGIFLMIVGVIEMTVGLAILTKLTRLGAYVAMAWLVLIACNLLLVEMLDVAVRDLAMAVGAYSLGTVAGLKGLAWLPGGVSRSAEQWNPHASSIR
jgi:hypothetical protein